VYKASSFSWGVHEEVNNKSGISDMMGKYFNTVICFNIENNGIMEGILPVNLGISRNFI